MQNPCQDSYYTLFSSYPMLLNYHEEQAKNSRWIRCKVADLQVEPLGESSPLIGNLPAFAAGTSQEAVKDTAENLRLAMRVNGELYPVRMTAYKSLLDRAKIGGTAKNIAAAAEDPDDKLRDRMYDDIDRVIVFDNENLKIEWKFDVAT